MKVEFPRDVGFLNPDARRDFARFTVQNAQEYVRTVAQFIDSRGSFVNVYSKRQQQASVIDKLFFDIDAKTLDEAQRKRREAQRFFDKLEWTFRENFSANKGFQMFVDFPEEVTIDWDELKDFCKRQNAIAGGIFDEAVFGDKNRICRVPHTPNYNGLRHQQGVLWCVPVERDWDLERCIAAAKREAPAANLEINFSLTAMRDVDSLCKDGARPFQSTKAFSNVVTTPLLTDEVKGYYSDLVNTILTLVAPNADDGRKAVLHFLLVPALVQLGCSDQQIHDQCRAFVERSGQGYARRYTRYIEDSIARTRARGYRPVPMDKFMTEHPELFR